ncbi:unnamed protein product, partial [Meganyctiphanes norvegica]
WPGDSHATQCVRILSTQPCAEGFWVTLSNEIAQGNVLCEDTNPSCSQWAANGECSKNPGFMLVNCRSSCYNCPSAQGNVLCEDTNPSCSQWAANGECLKNPGFMLVNCRSSCNHCPAGSASTCSPRLCSGSQVEMDGKCYQSNDASVCPPTMVLHTNEFGTGECDCPEGTIYYQQTNRCYTPYSQGPCQDGFIIKVIVTDDRGDSQCVINPCPAENQVALDRNCIVTGRTSLDSQCHSINSAGPCDSGTTLSIDGTNAEAGCSDRSIFGLGSIPCRRGSRRDGQGECKEMFVARGGRRPNQNRRPQNSKCKPNERQIGPNCIPRG